MTWLLVGTVAFIAFCWLMWNAKKAGKDSVKAKAAEKTVEQIVDATGPVSPTQRERLRSRYRRD